MRTYWGMLTAAVVLMGMGRARRGETQDAPTPPDTQMPLAVWKPQPKLLRQLARQVRISPYTMQPPMGYAVRQAKQASLVLYGWQGRVQSTGIAPTLTFAVGRVPLVGNKKIGLEALLANSLSVLKRTYGEWTQTPTERGQIGGLTFARTYWTAAERGHKRKLRGVSYVAVDDTNAIILTGLDAAPAGKQPVRANASAQADANSPDPNQPDPTQNNPEGGDPNANPAEADSDDFTPATIDRLQLAEAAIQTFRRVGTSKTP